MTTALHRPRPPSTVLDLSGYDRFEPDHAFAEWLRDAYLTEGGPLYAPEHAHLLDAKIGVLWTTAENRRGGRRVVGQAELVRNIRMPAWQRARHEYQLHQWFGDVPDFVLTFDAFYADEAADLAFCALVDHELNHCAQERDENGLPKFCATTGRPKFCIRGHDVEEFVSVVRRFGIEAAGSAAVDLVVAAAKAPEIGAAQIDFACGNCMRLAA